MEAEAEAAEAEEGIVVDLVIVMWLIGDTKGGSTEA